MRRYGGIEAGGTKFVCAVGTGPDDLIRTVIPTGEPAATVEEEVAWFRTQGSIEAVGIASFGPADIDPASPKWGYITSTPKAGWLDFDFAGSVQRALGIPIAFDTDVNAALLAEAEWGAARGLSNCVYMTIGTGIGGAAMISGRLVNGASHPEMGHIRVPHDHAADPFKGSCPFHGDCLEGLASGPAIAARWGARGESLPGNHPAWDLEAQYLALGLASLSCVLAPDSILLGGGVMRLEHLFPRIRTRLSELLAGYIKTPEVLPPGLGPNAGVLGAILLAKRLHSC